MENMVLCLDVEANFAAVVTLVIVLRDRCDNKNK